MEKNHLFKLKIIGSYYVPNHVRFHMLFHFPTLYLTRYNHKYYLRES